VHFVTELLEPAMSLFIDAILEALGLPKTGGW
jgi:hypothetical protein